MAKINYKNKIWKKNGKFAKTNSTKEIKKIEIMNNIQMRRKKRNEFWEKKPKNLQE